MLRIEMSLLERDASTLIAFGSLMHQQALQMRTVFDSLVCRDGNARSLEEHSGREGA